MKIKNDDVLILYETLTRLIENKELKFNVITGYIMAKNKAVLEPIATLIYNMRRDTVLEYGTSDGEEIQIPKEKIDELNQKIEDLMNVENDVDITQVSIHSFEENKLALEDIVGLTYMIKPFDLSEITIPEESDAI